MLMLKTIDRQNCPSFHHLPSTYQYYFIIMAHTDVSEEFLKKAFKGVEWKFCIKLLLLTFIAKSILHVAFPRI